jgi:chromosome transmission fidelity protein 8
MIIPITLKPPSEDGRKLPPQLANLGNGDLVLIEFQGSLEVQGSADSKFVGTLEIDPKTVCALLATIAKRRTLTKARPGFQNKPSLAIGPHLLEGKIVSLPTPLAIMKKKLPPNDEISGMDVDEDENKEEAGVKWEISAIVKKKVVFATRPMPMLNRPVSKIGKK